MSNDLPLSSSRGHDEDHIQCTHFTDEDSEAQRGCHQSLWASGEVSHGSLGLPSRKQNTVMTKISEEVTKLNYGVSSAMAWVYFLCVIIILGIISLIISKRVYYYE